MSRLVMIVTLVCALGVGGAGHLIGGELHGLHADISHVSGAFDSARQGVGQGVATVNAGVDGIRDAPGYFNAATQDLSQVGQPGQ